MFPIASIIAAVQLPSDNDTAAFPTDARTLPVAGLGPAIRRVSGLAQVTTAGNRRLLDVVVITLGQSTSGQRNVVGDDAHVESRPPAGSQSGFRNDQKMHFEGHGTGRIEGLRTQALSGFVFFDLFR